MYITYETVQVKQQKLINAIRDEEFIQIAKKYVTISLQLYTKLLVILWLMIVFAASVLMLTSERLFDLVSTKLSTVYASLETKNKGVNSTTLAPIFESSIPDTYSPLEQPAKSNSSKEEAHCLEFSERIELYLEVAFERDDRPMLRNIVDYVTKSVGDLPNSEALQKAKQILAQGKS